MLLTCLTDVLLNDLIRIWSVDCAGILRAGVFHGEKIYFYIDDEGYVFVLGEPVTNPLNEREVKGKRGISVADLPSNAEAILSIKAVKATTVNSKA